MSLAVDSSNALQAESEGSERQGSQSSAGHSSHGRARAARSQISTAVSFEDAHAAGSAIQPAHSVDEESALSAAEGDVAGPLRPTQRAEPRRPANSQISTALPPPSYREQYASSPNVHRTTSIASQIGAAFGRPLPASLLHGHLAQPLGQAAGDTWQQASAMHGSMLGHAGGSGAPGFAETSPAAAWGSGQQQQAMQPDVHSALGGGGVMPPGMLHSAFHPFQPQPVHSLLGPDALVTAGSNQQEVSVKSGGGHQPQQADWAMAAGVQQGLSGAAGVPGAIDGFGAAASVPGCSYTAGSYLPSGAPSVAHRLGLPTNQMLNDSSGDALAMSHPALAGHTFASGPSNGHHQSGLYFPSGMPLQNGAGGQAAGSSGQAGFHLQELAGNTEQIVEMLPNAAAGTFGAGDAEGGGQGTGFGLQAVFPQDLPVGGFHAAMLSPVGWPPTGAASGGGGPAASSGIKDEARASMDGAVMHQAPSSPGLVHYGEHPATANGSRAGQGTDGMAYEDALSNVAAPAMQGAAVDAALYSQNHSVASRPSQPPHHDGSSGYPNHLDMQAAMSIVFQATSRVIGNHSQQQQQQESQLQEVQNDHHGSAPPLHASSVAGHNFLAGGGGSGGVATAADVLVGWQPLLMPAAAAADGADALAGPQASTSLQEGPHLRAESAAGMSPSTGGGGGSRERGGGGGGRHEAALHGSTMAVSLGGEMRSGGDDEVAGGRQLQSLHQRGQQGAGSPSPAVAFGGSPDGYDEEEVRRRTRDSCTRSHSHMQSNGPPRSAPHAADHQALSSAVADWRQPGPAPLLLSMQQQLGQQQQPQHAEHNGGLDADARAVQLEAAGLGAGGQGEALAEGGCMLRSMSDVQQQLLDQAHPAASVHATVAAEEVMSEGGTSMHQRLATRGEGSHRSKYDGAGSTMGLTVGSGGGMGGASAARGTGGGGGGHSHEGSRDFSLGGGADEEIVSRSQRWGSPSASPGMAEASNPLAGHAAAGAFSPSPPAGIMSEGRGNRRDRAGMAAHDSSMAIATLGRSPRSGTISGGGTVDMQHPGSALNDSQIANVSVSGGDSEEDAQGVEDADPHAQVVHGPPQAAGLSHGELQDGMEAGQHQVGALPHFAAVSFNGNKSAAPATSNAWPLPGGGGGGSYGGQPLMTTKSNSSNGRQRPAQGHQGSTGHTRVSQRALAGDSTLGVLAAYGAYPQELSQAQGGALQMPQDAAMECVQSADFDAEEEDQQGSGIFEEERGENHEPRPLPPGAGRVSGGSRGCGGGGRGESGPAVAHAEGGMSGRAGRAASAAVATMHHQAAAGAAVSSATGAAVSSPLEPLTGFLLRRNHTTSNTHINNVSGRSAAPGGGVGCGVTAQPGTGSAVGHWEPPPGLNYHVLPAGGGGTQGAGISELEAGMQADMAAGRSLAGVLQQQLWCSNSGPEASVGGVVPQVTEVHGLFPPPVGTMAAAAALMAADLRSGRAISIDPYNAMQDEEVMQAETAESFHEVAPQPASAGMMTAVGTEDGDEVAEQMLQIGQEGVPLAEGGEGGEEADSGEGHDRARSGEAATAVMEDREEGQDEAGPGASGGPTRSQGGRGEQLANGAEMGGQQRRGGGAAASAAAAGPGRGFSAFMGGGRHGSSSRGFRGSTHGGQQQQQQQQPQGSSLLGQDGGGDSYQLQQSSGHGRYSYAPHYHHRNNGLQHAEVADLAEREASGGPAAAEGGGASTGANKGSEEAAQLQEVQQADHNYGDGAEAEVNHHAEAVLLLPGRDDGADAEGQTSNVQRLMIDGPPQPQLTIVVNSTHHPASGDTDSLFHDGVDANDADDELDGPRVAHHGGGRLHIGSGRHGHHYVRQHSASAYAGPATSATGAAVTVPAPPEEPGRPAGEHGETAPPAGRLGSVAAADISGQGGGLQAAGRSGAALGPRRRGEKRKRGSHAGLANEVNGSRSGAGSQSS